MNEQRFWLLFGHSPGKRGIFIFILWDTPSLRKPVLQVNASNSKQTQNITLSIHLFHRRFQRTAAKVAHFRPFQNLVKKTEE